MYVCVYVQYVHIYIRTYVCVCIPIYVRMYYVCTFIHMYEWSYLLYVKVHVWI